LTLSFFATKMIYSSVVTTARYTGEILEPVRAAFSSMEFENMEKRLVCTSRHLVVYNQHAREQSGRRTMAV
jgi:hypothetical protein